MLALQAGHQDAVEPASAPGPQLDSMEAHSQAVKDDQLPAGYLPHTRHDLDSFQGL